MDLKKDPASIFLTGLFEDNIRQRQQNLKGFRRLNRKVLALKKRVAEMEILLSAKCLVDMQGRVVYSPHIEKEIAILREGLEFYKEGWGSVECVQNDDGSVSVTESSIDKGQKARTALAAADELRGLAIKEKA